MVSELETDRLLLRRWREGDLDAYATLNADPEVTRFLAGRPYVHEESAAQIARFTRHWDEHGFGLWAVEANESGEMIGFIGFLRHDDWFASPFDAEIGWRLARHAWGRGMATEGARAALEHGFTLLGFERVISITRPDNLASRRVMEKLGLRPEGETHWRGRDVVWYAIERRDWADRAGARRQQ